MSFNKRKFFNRIIFPIFISLFLFLNHIKCETTLKTDLEKDEQCSYNLECRTGCCVSGKCSDTGECSVTKVYTVQIIVCIVLVAIFIIVLIVKLRRINTDFLQKQDDLNKMNKNNNYNNYNKPY